MANPSIYINPKFRNAHINPNFLPKYVTKPTTTQQSQPPPHLQPAAPPIPTSIYVNPNFLRPTHIQPDTVTAHAHQPQHQLPHQFPVAATPIYSQARIISQTNRKLVRQPIVPPATTTKPLQPIAATCSPLLRIGMRKLVRRVSVAPTIRPTVAFKAKQHVTTKPTDVHTPNKYRLRNTAVPSSAPINRYKFDRRSSATTTTTATTSSYIAAMLARRQMLRIQTPTKTPHMKLVYLNINGVFYKSTKNKLQRHDQTNATTTKLSTSSLKPTYGSTVPKTAALSLSIRGTKFTLSADGKRLQRNHIGGSAAARLDIGGVTYVRVAPDTFERTDGHRTRDHLTAARQKSIQLLLAAGSRTKSNVPCMIFQRLGKCKALERGRCPRVHDAKRVAICPKFLQGSCRQEPCLLSHAVTLAKMPVCKFYLAGICAKDDCPYLHKKLNARADICTDFLRGFCERADECDKRHEFLCPEHTATGKCDKSHCPYPHGGTGTSKKATITTTKTTTTRRDQNPPTAVADAQRCADDASVSDMPRHMRDFAPARDERTLERVLAKVRSVKARYTNGNARASAAPADGDNAPANSTADAPPTTAAGVDGEVLVLIPSRPKLGALPSYIPF